MHKCLLKVLYTVSRPITTLVWVLWKVNSRAPVARSGPEINPRACLCVLQVPRHNASCCFPIQRFNFILIFCLKTPKKGSGPTNRWAEPHLASLSAVSFPLTPAWPWTLYSPTACRVEMSFNVCWHCRRVQLERDGTRWRTGGEVKGKLANGMSSQYPSHHRRSWCIQHYYRWCAHLGCQ